METVRIRYTRGDTTTIPGGIIMRKRERSTGTEWIVHYFNREYGSKTPTDYHQGSYIFDENKAHLEFSRRENSRIRTLRGGSLIPDDQVDRELEIEASAVRAGQRLEGAETE